MQSRLLLKKERIKLKRSGKQYFEAHHIVPKSMGGGGQINGYRSLIHPNIVILTAREHYIAHALLFLIHRNRKMSAAFLAMCAFIGRDSTGKLNVKARVKTSSRLYEAAREEYNKIGPSQETREKMSKKFKGRVASQETREKLRQANLGKKHSDATKEKIRQINLGKKYPKEVGEKRGLKLRGRFVSAETREKLRQINLGNKHALGRVVSEETRRKIGINSGNARRGMKQTPEHVANVQASIKRNIELGLTKPRVISPETRAKMEQTKKQKFLLKCAEMEKMGFVRTKNGKKWTTIEKLNSKRTMPSHTKEKVRQANLRKTVSSETREKMRQANLGKTLSSETREKISKTLKGRKRSPETIAKVVESNKRARLLKLAQQNGDGVQGG